MQPSPCQYAVTSSLIVSCRVSLYLLNSRRPLCSAWRIFQWNTDRLEQTQGGRLLGLLSVAFHHFGIAAPRSWPVKTAGSMPEQLCVQKAPPSLSVLPIGPSAAAVTCIQILWPAFLLSLRARLQSLNHIGHAPLFSLLSKWGARI